MDSVEKRIKKAIELSGCKTRKAFAGLINVTPDALKKWENRDGGITPAGILKITDKVNISRTYLETGTGLPELNASGISDYVHEDRVDELVQMYKELDPNDQRLIYQMTKRCHMQIKNLNSKLDDLCDFK